VTVIDGAKAATSSVVVDASPQAVAVNPNIEQNLRRKLRHEHGDGDRRATNSTSTVAVDVARKPSR